MKILINEAGDVDHVFEPFVVNSHNHLVLSFFYRHLRDNLIAPKLRTRVLEKCIYVLSCFILFYFIGGGGVCPVCCFSFSFHAVKFILIVCTYLKKSIGI